MSGKCGNKKSSKGLEKETKQVTKSTDTGARSLIVKELPAVQEEAEKAWSNQCELL